MKNKNLLYFAINIVFITCAVLFINFNNFSNINFSFPSIIVILLLFLLAHFFRFIRMYFILLEDLINPNRFLQIYLKTTFVSTLIPFKIGEIFKMYCYGVETDSYAKGIVAVIIEKFFDAIVLCIFMIPHAIQSTIPNVLLIIMASFIVIAMTIFLSFERTYCYLNQFLIRRGGGQKSLFVLKILEVSKKTYDNTKRTLRGRSAIILLLSVLAWSAETALLILMNAGADFDLNMIYVYINDAFFGINNTFFTYYTNLCAIIFPSIIAIIYGKKYFTIIKERRIHG